MVICITCSCVSTKSINWTANVCTALETILEAFQLAKHPKRGYFSWGGTAKIQEGRILPPPKFSKPDPQKIRRKIWELGWGGSVPSRMYGICNYYFVPTLPYNGKFWWPLNLAKFDKIFDEFKIWRFAG